MRFTSCVTLGKANSSESWFYYPCNVDNEASCSRLLENLNEIWFRGLLDAWHVYVLHHCWFTKC